MATWHPRKRRDQGGATPAAGPEAPDGPDAGASEHTDLVTVERDEPVDKHADETVAEPPDEDAHEDTGPPAEDDPSAVIAAEREQIRGRLALSVADSAPVTLFLAAHPKQTLVTAAGVAVAAAASGRAAREVGAVFATVLVGQAILGWHNDIVDRDRDALHGTARKPVAQGRLDAGTAWFALAVAVLLVVPLSISTGITAGVFYLLSLVAGILGNVALRKGRFSFLPWAASFALYPAYLSYGGWGGDADGGPPQVALVVLAALLGVGVHVLRSIWGLVDDDADGWSYYPLRLGRRLGATRLLVLASAYVVAVVAALAVVGSATGLRQ